MPGCFVLREADDAAAIRDYVQRQAVRTAVVAGGGLLGLEAAFALLKLGMDVHVLERSAHLLTRQLDPQAAQCLQDYLTGLGIRLHYGAEAHAALGATRLERLQLGDRQEIACGVLVYAMGMVASADLAREAQLDCDRGVVVDPGMRTSDPSVFAAGDVAQGGKGAQIAGLWPVAVEQGRVAAINALGGSETWVPKPAVTALKVAGISVSSLGRITVGDDDQSFTIGEPDRYRKIIMSNGAVVGAILIGYPEWVPRLSKLISSGRSIESAMPAMQNGDWSGIDKA
jgi:NAD(P)H-nitrite reductase large subunit